MVSDASGGHVPELFAATRCQGAHGIDAMLDYEPNTDRLCRWKKKRHFEYNQAYLRGRWASDELMTDKERKQVKVLIGFEL